MNILIVVNNFNVGGLERVVINLIKELFSLNIKPYVVCLDGEGELFDGVKPYITDSLVLSKRPGIDIPTILKIRSYIKKNRISVVHTHNLSPLVYAGLASKLFIRHINHVYTEHNQVSRMSERELKKFKLYMKLATKIVTVSSALKKMFESKLNAKNVSVVYNGLSIKDFVCQPQGKIRKEFGINSDDYLLCLIGILKPQKGIQYLLGAMKQLSGVEKIKLLIAGDGALKEELVTYVEKEKLKNVIFAGYRNDLCEIYTDSDLVVMSSVQEGLPMALIESLAVGRPVVTTDVGGCAEVIIDGEHGKVIKSCDSQSLKDAILSYYEKPPNMIEQERINKQRFKENFSAESMCQSYLALYK